MISEVTPQGEVDYAYDNIGRHTSMIIKNGSPGTQAVQSTITYVYDNANRLTAMSQAAGAINAGQAQSITYAYSAAGQLTQLVLANGSTATYSYDAAGQAVSIVYKKANGTSIGDLQYSYDERGRKSGVGGSLARMSLPPADVTDATYDADNRLTVWAGNSYSYDDNGNLTNDGTSAFNWNERNRLTSITAGGATVATFQYDSVGRRVGKECT